MDVKSIVTSFLCGIAGAVLFTTIHNHFYQERVATVDVSGIINRHVEKYGAEIRTEKELAEIREEFTESLDSIIDILSHRDNVVLLVSRAVVSEVPDYTDVVEDAINAQLER